MSTGQSLLSLGALLLLMLLTTNISRSYVAGVVDTVNQQRAIEAINVGQTMSERLLAAASSYDALDALFGDAVIPHVTVFGDTLHAHVALSTESLLQGGVPARIATITVYHQGRGAARPLVVQKLSLNALAP